MPSKQNSAVHALAAFVSFLVTVASPAVKAEVVFGNLGPNGTDERDGSATIPTSTTFFAQGFTTETSNLNVQSISAYFGRTGTINPNVSATLWEASGGNPGSILASSLPETINGNGFLLETFTFQPDASLLPNTTYFFGFTNLPSDISFRWGAMLVGPTAQNQSGYSYANSRIFSSGQWGSGDSATQLLSLSINAVPEPGNLALLGAGGVLIASGWLRRRVVAKS